MLHAWAIEAREYSRHETRRGRRHAYDALMAERTALVVVDMVPFFLDENPYARGIVPNVNRVAATLRAAGGTVAWVVPAPAPPTERMKEFFGPEVAARYAASGGVGPPATRVAPDLDVAPTDLVEEKRAPSAFFPGQCTLHDQLAARDVETVIVAGTVANVCCESTARDANALGYRVVMAADANAALRDADLNATLHTVYRSFGDVRSTDDIVELIDAARTCADV